LQTQAIRSIGGEFRLAGLRPSAVSTRQVFFVWARDTGGSQEPARRSDPMPTSLFPLAEYWWFYLVFTAAILLLLSLDLSLHRGAQVMPIRRAAQWTAGWVSLALAFSGGLYVYSSVRFGVETARRLTMEFLAGYAVEEALSIDNMFVFALVFGYFGIAQRFQHRVLFYGVLGAIVFRGIFIAAGSALVRFHWVVIAFGIFLLYTSVRLAFEKERELAPDANPLIRLVRRFVPVTSEMHGGRFSVRQAGKLAFTPLMIALLALETTDIMFAIDSVPAVFGVTREPLLVYTSNIFAILGLRSMYFLLAGAMNAFRLLKYGIAAVLAFVGLKMALLDQLAGGRFPVGWSLAIIAGTIAISILLSLTLGSAAKGKPAPPVPPAA
jgi:tellurite resistance protein TerC